MPRLQKPVTQKGFTLIELLIVILIVSMVYFLGFSAFEKPKNTVKTVTLLKLKSVIKRADTFQGEATFICIDQCKSCYLRTNIQTPFESYSLPINLEQTKAYTLNSSNELIDLEYGRYQDEKICLVLNFYPNGSSTQIILEHPKGVYFFPAFFGEAKRFDNLEDAKDFWLKQSDILSDTGAFY